MVIFPLLVKKIASFELKLNTTRLRPGITFSTNKRVFSLTVKYFSTNLFYDQEFKSNQIEKGLRSI